jgi:hypothetical protein
MTTHVNFCVDFAVNSLNSYRSQKKNISDNIFREEEKMHFVINEVLI